MKFSIKDLFSKCDQIRSFLRIWSRLLKKSLIENFIFCAVCKKCIWNWHVKSAFNKKASFFLNLLRANLPICFNPFIAVNISKKEHNEKT